MGVSNTPNRIGYAGNGATTTFNFPYYFFATTDLAVYLYDTVAGTATLQTLGSNYTVSGTPNAQGLYPSGANVVMSVAPASTAIVVIINVPSPVNNYSLLQNAPVSSTALVQQLDYLTLLTQRMQDQINRAILLPDGMGATFNTKLPSTIALPASAGSTVAVNPSGTGLSLAPTLTNPMTASGDVIYGGANGAPTRLPAGSNTQVLTQVGGVPAWANNPSGFANPMTTTGDMMISNPGATPARLAAGAQGQFFNQGASIPAWAWDIPTVVAKTTTYSILNSDNLILCSGSAFTVTLPTAIGITGKVYKIKKTDASLTNIITVATTSAQTIDGVTTTTLNTQYEMIEVVSDGANWQLLRRSYPQVMVAYTPTFVGLGTATGVAVYSRRVGDSLEVQGKATAGTATGSTASISFGYNGTDSNVTWDSTKVASSTLVGSMAVNLSGATIFNWGITTWASTSSTVAIGIQNSTTSLQTAGTGSGTIGTGGVFQFYFKIPIVGWNG